MIVGKYHGMYTILLLCMSSCHYRAIMRLHASCGRDSKFDIIYVYTQNDNQITKIEKNKEKTLSGP